MASFLKAFFKAKVFFSCVLMLVITTTTSFAGDFSTRNIIGFSNDGSKFAFEEYGVQDGSGFPFSSIYLIDTKTDNWIEGSPWRARLDDETKTVDDARAAAKALAGYSLEQISEDGFIAATNRYTEIVADPSKIKANPRSYVPSGAKPIEFKIEQTIYPNVANCSYVEDVKGFKLSQVFEGSNSKILHDDKSVPTSRNCPLNYSFADIVTYHPPKGTPVAAILILVQSRGFEGPNGRFLAVTTPLN